MAATGQRQNGVITGWRLSPHGGMGRVFSQGELFFICRAFVVKGDPITGTSCSFVPQPAREGTRFRQATEVIVDNSRVLRGDERTPKTRPKVHPKLPVIKVPASLTGGGK